MSTSESHLRDLCLFGLFLHRHHFDLPRLKTPSKTYHDTAYQNQRPTQKQQVVKMLLVYFLQESARSWVTGETCNRYEDPHRS
jgi:hypothetical protein